MEFNHLDQNKRRSRKCRTVWQRRSIHGNMLVFMAATLFLVLTLLIFGLQLLRITGTQHEQTTAIEAATLAAARDLGVMVIQDPYFGFVGLSDAAPCGKRTVAGDGFDLPVQSINTLFATIRLNMIIADQLQDPILVQLAQRDYGLARTTATNLQSALDAAVLPSGVGYDINNTPIKPYDDAVAAYQSNIIRMTGSKHILVAGSLQLTLGSLPPLITNTQIPQPDKFAAASAQQQQDDYYNAYIDVPYKHYDFVFTGVGDDTVLVDQRQFLSSNASLPYLVASTVQCSADEQYWDKDSYGNPLQRIVHARACAEPGNMIDQRPSPGALTLSFPTGTPPELTKPLDLWTSTQLVQSPCDFLQTPLNGDYPPSPLSQFRLPLINDDHPSVGQAMSVAFYDWMRRQGYRLNVQAVIDMFNTPFSIISAGAGQVNVYQATPKGQITYFVYPMSPNTDIALSQNQWRATSGDAFRSGNPLNVAAVISGSVANIAQKN